MINRLDLDEKGSLRPTGMVFDKSWRSAINWLDLDERVSAIN